MADGLETVVTAPVLCTLADGKEYRLAKLTLEDWAAFCEWIKAERRKEIGAAPLGGQDKQALYRDLIRDPVDHEDMFRHAMTIAGLRWLIHRGIVAHHPSVAINEVGALVGNLARMTELFALISDLPEDEGDKEAAADFHDPTMGGD